VLPSPGTLSRPTSPPISSRQVPRQRQAQAGAAVAPGGGVVGLLEGLEQAGLRSGAMPSPVS
jgi:hypothetical protein